MMWIIFVLLLLLLVSIAVIMYLFDKLDELQMYLNEIEVKKLLGRISNVEVSSDAKN